jgi:heptosyltransferase-2
LTKVDLNRILVVQTAFAGDVVLAIPLIQVLKRNYPSAKIDFLVIPRVADLLANHPAINDVIIFDKRNKDSGLGGLIRLSGDLRKKKYDIAFVPHRSIRSAVLVRLAGIKKRVGFDKSTGSFLFTDVVHYQSSIHEIKRNLSLLRVIDIEPNSKEYPQLFPSHLDRNKVDLLLSEFEIQQLDAFICVAPGSVWNTKRWLKERFIELIEKLTGINYHVVFVGGREDSDLCEEIRSTVSSKQVFSAAGKLSLLQSAELIRRCRVLISNDSAPMHLAVSVGTPVVAIFGATDPKFGFAPYGANDIVVETKGLPCRPCSIHGGKRCPIRTFDCMKLISANDVYDKVINLIKSKPV